MKEDFTQAERSKVIGGTDAGIIAGYNPWTTSFDLYMEKKGQVPPKDMNMAMEVGLALEPVVADKYIREMNGEVRLITPELMRHPKHSFIVGHLDRLVFPLDDSGKPIRGLEIKTTNPFNSADWGQMWSDEIPKMYFAQVMHYMAITGLDHFDVPVLIGNNDFRVYRVHRQDAVISALLELELIFWENLQNDRPPEVSAGKRSQEYLNSRYPKDSGIELVVADDEDIFQIIKELADVRLKAKTMEKVESGFKNRIMAYMGDASKLTCSIGSISWKKAKDGQKVDWDKLAAEAQIPADLIASHTTVKEGSRSFRPYFKNGGDE